ncbi:LGFP repeat-containing protein, partial [Mesorhizobium japonicum]|uniref:LGFP repeat-containing protein n=1 Tax=Mesorhizobium japonicum TaxID=2066070 RepID=UPI003B593A75
AGAPTAAQVCGLSGGGCLERFVNGSYYWSPSTGAHYVPSGSMAAWGSVGYEFGSLGYPVGEPIATRGGVSQTFQRGTIFISGTGAVQITR